MTATQTQIRRDTSANLAGVTPALSELGHDTTNNRLVVGDGVTAGGIKIPKAADLITNYFTAATAGGSANALTLDLPVNAAAYTQNMIVRFKAANTNTGAATIDVDGLGAKNIYKISGGAIGALSAGDIIAGGMYELAYDGTQFQLLNMQVPVVSSNGMDLISAVDIVSAFTADFTSGITSAYKNYLLALSDFRTSGVLSTELWLRLGDGGTASYYSGGSDYAYSYAKQAGATASQAASSGSAIKLATDLKYSNSRGFSGSVLISAPTGRKPQVNWCGGHNDIDAGGSMYNFSGQGYCNAANNSQLDSIRIMMSSSQAFTSGHAYLYGLKG